MKKVKLTTNRIKQMLKSDSLEKYLRDRLQREDKGNNKGYRGHTLVIQETYLNNPTNIKIFTECVNDVGYVHLTPKVNGMPDTDSYKQVCECTSSEVNLTLLKNLVPTAFRMGLIDLDKNGRENIGFKLSVIGNNILNIDNLPINRQQSEMLLICDNLARNLFNYYKLEKGFDFIDMIQIFLNDYGFSSIDLNEMFILIDDVIGFEEKRDLILSYKRLTNSPLKRMNYENLVKNIFEEYNNVDASKLEKRDFGNVRNQISRIMEKLNLMFLYTYDPTRLLLTVKHNFGVIKTTRFRTGQDIREAKEQHSIVIDGLDGHHIIPHEFISTYAGKDRALIENWKNIILLSKENHSKFPNKNNPYLILSYDENNIEFHTLSNSDKVVIPISEFYGNLNLLSDMVIHNQNILKYLIETKLV